MPEERISFDCIEVEQPLAIFYVGVMEAADLVAISHTDVRQLVANERGLDNYIGFQRELNDKRVRELHEYVNYVDATFPTSILLAIKSGDVEYDAENRRMSVRRDESAATVIDGQHRIAGLENAERTFQTAVTIFIDLDLEDKAHVFSTINLKQTRVNPSLARELSDLARARSPMKTAHNITRLLNSANDSPLYHRIKMLGIATEGREGETVTQALIVDQILDMITWNAARDRNVTKKGGELDPGTLTQRQRYPFRRHVIAENDAVIARCVWNVLDAARTRWPRAWNEVRPRHMLNRTTGVFVLLRFLREYYARLSDDSSVVQTQEFIHLFKDSDLGEDDFTAELYPSGGQGRAALWREVFRPLLSGD